MPSLSLKTQTNQRSAIEMSMKPSKTEDIPNNVVVVKAEEPPFPWLAMTALSSGMLAHSVVFTSPMPFVAFMIVDFGMSPTLDSAGYYAGWITGTFMIGRAFAGIPWGLASDRWGRKPCLMLSMFNVALFGVVFGFSTNFHMAVLSRLAIGLGNGFMGVAKVCVSEIVQTKEHELRGFGIINGIWGLGMIIGPAVGGILSRPAIQYPYLFSQHSIWASYPYLLPCMVCSSMALAAMIMIYFFLDETMTSSSSSSSSSNCSMIISQLYRIYDNITGRTSYRDEQVYDMLSNSSSHGTSLSSSSSSTTSSSLTSTSSDTDLTIIDDEENRIGKCIMEMQSSSKLSYDMIHEQLEADTDDETDDIEEIVFKNSSSHHNQYVTINPNNDHNHDHKHDHLISKSLKPSTFHSVIHDPSIQFLFIVYMSFCFIITFVDESTPLWAVTTIDEGGLAFTSAETGAMLASVGFGLVIYQLFFYEALIVKYFNKGSTDTIYRLAMIAALGLVFIPVSSTLAVMFTQYYHNQFSSTTRVLIIHTFVLFMQLFYRCSGTSAFSTLAVIVNGSVDKEMRGTINGLIMTMGSVGNALGPIIGSIVYASLVDAPKPFDGRWIFWIAAMFMVAYACLCKRNLRVADEN